MTLEEIGITHGTDKVPFGYLPIYEELFSKFPDEGVRFLEIGVQYGRSLRMWMEWRPKWDIRGLDIDPAAPGHIFGDQGDAAFMDRVGADLRPHIVVDDGGHKGDEQLVSLRALWPHLPSGALYCVEDLHTAYRSCWGSQFRDWLTTTVDTVNGKGDPAFNIRSVFLYKSLAILRKA